TTLTIIRIMPPSVVSDSGSQFGLTSMLITLALLTLAADPTPDVAVVCPKEYRTALAPWLEHRQSQGHVVEVLESAGTAVELQKKIRAVATGGNLTHIVLVGDADVARNVGARPSTVPTFKQKAEVNVKFGSEPDIAADNPYADLDDDGLPDVAIGRLSI